MFETACQIVFGIAAVIALASAVRFFIILKAGKRINAEIVKSREIKQGCYVHTLRFEYKNKTYEKEDTAEYSEPIPKGETREIVFNPKKPQKVHFTSELKKGAVLSLGVVLGGILLVLRFRYWVEK